MSGVTGDLLQQIAVNRNTGNDDQLFLAHRNDLGYAEIRTPFIQDRRFEVMIEPGGSGAVEECGVLLRPLRKDRLSLEKGDDRPALEALIESLLTGEHDPDVLGACGPLRDARSDLRGDRPIRRL